MRDRLHNIQTEGRSRISEEQLFNCCQALLQLTHMNFMRQLSIKTHLDNALRFVLQNLSSQLVIQLGLDFLLVIETGGGLSTARRRLAK